MANGVHSTSFRTTPKTILDAYRGRTILVTGGRGFIGSALTQSLSDINCKLILLDQSPADVWRPTGQQAKVLIQQGDVAVRKTWEMALSGVDTVFHLAAPEYHFRTEYDPERDLTFNALPTLHLLEVCRSQQYRPQIVFASSANVFGAADALPVNEDTRDDPLTMWAIHKLAAEQYFRLYAQQFGISTIILRLANAYGPTARRAVMTRMVINNMIAKALEGKALTTYVNRGCKRDFVFLEDVVQAFLLAGQHGGTAKSPMYVIGGGEDKTIEEVWHLIAQTIGAHTGRDIPVGCDESVEIEPVEWRHFTADTARFRCDAGWEPKTTLTQGIDITVRTFLSDSRQFT